MDGSVWGMVMRAGYRPVVGSGGQRPGGGWAKVWPGPGKGQNSPSLSGPSPHGRKVQLADVVRIFPQAFPGAQPAEVYVDVPENYGGNFPLYLTKVSLRYAWAALAPSPASPTSSTPFSFLLWLSFNPAFETVCGIA